LKICERGVPEKNKKFKEGRGWEKRSQPLSRRQASLNNNKGNIMRKKGKGGSFEKLNVNWAAGGVVQRGSKLSCTRMKREGIRI